MARLVYRGVAYSKPEARPRTLAEQIRKPDLVYRGVEHDGERPVPDPMPGPAHVYRGVRYA